MKRMAFNSNPVLRLGLPAWRSRFVLFLLFAGFIALGARAMYLQGVFTDFLQKQGESRYARTLELQPTRGKISDRNGVVLASSVPARAIWAIPEDVKAPADKLGELARLMGMPLRDLQQRLAKNEDRTFLYLKRQVPMDVAEKIEALKLEGIHQQRETLRTYPEGEVIAHVLGFTNIEGKGQEGMELAYEEQLAGKPGSRRVIKDRIGRVVEDVQAIQEPIHGHDLTLSIDSRVQYLAFSHLKAAVEEYEALGGAALVADARTGEILALVNLPTYNPSDRSGLTGSQLRNRALTDTFEPGSTIKPFTVALALELGRIKPTTMFDTGNGKFNFAGATISDVSRNGMLDTAGVLRKSSNIGLTLIQQHLQATEMWHNFSALGIGQAPRLGFPGAVAGRLRPHERWRPIEKATMSYGYGLSVSLVQLVHAYTAFARNGDTIPLTFMKQLVPATGTQVYVPEVAKMVRGMLEQAAGPEGATRAQVAGYRVAGKSGTARKIVNGAYSRTKYVGSFVGLAPVSNPRIVVAVMLDEPSSGGYYGGRVAAPVFSQIVGGTLRVLSVEPDAPFKSMIDEPIKNISTPPPVKPAVRPAGRM